MRLHTHSKQSIVIKLAFATWIKVCRLDPSDGWRLKHRPPQPSFLFLSQFSCLQLPGGLSSPHSTKKKEKKIHIKNNRTRLALFFFPFNQIPLFLQSCECDGTQELLQCVLSQSHSLYLTLRTVSLCPGAHLSAAALPEQKMENLDQRASVSAGGMH